MTTMRIVICWMTAVLLAGGVLPRAVAAQALDRPAGAGLTLHGKLASKESWRAYKARFVTEPGRVVDTANGAISHSEGQGYGMLLAVAADDRAGFERIWGWTRANLLVRGDALAAWRWEPDRRPAVADMNNASDGDLLIAWALAEAGQAWNDAGYTVAARRAAVEIGSKLVVRGTPQGAVLLPGLAGFSADERADGPVLNLSYYVFPAFERLALVAPEFDWAGLGRAGLRLLDKARFGPAKLPSDWIALGSGAPVPAQGFPAQFSYNALRIPLYLAWGGFDQPRHHADYLALWGKRDRRGLPLVEMAQGQPAIWLEEKGYRAIPALSACASAGTRFPRELRGVDTVENYYPATLHLLSLVAAQMRYPSCLRD